MGNTNGGMWPPPQDESQYSSALFHALDVRANGYLTLKDLLDAPSPGLMLPHSLPALYFFDLEKKGRLTEEEFTCLVDYCQAEKRKVEEALCHDKNFRDLILRASKAGVKDCSVRNRSSYRRLSSYSKVRSVFCSRRDTHADNASSASTVPANPSANSSHANLESDHSETHPQSFSPNHEPFNNSSFDAHTDERIRPHSPVNSSSSSEAEDIRDSSEQQSTQSPDNSELNPPSISASSCVAMYSSQRDIDHFGSNDNPDSIEGDVSSSDPDLLNPQNRTAIDVAVVENISIASIHKLADLLHTEGSREKFMQWLWALADFYSTGVVTLEELGVFLAALSEDGIDLEELAFHKEGGEPLEVSIMNEFDTTHAGLLSRDEFMVLADLVTREYEFWENRHLERIGDYELGRTIGRGSSGVVRLAFHVENRQKFAVKIIKKGKCSDLSRIDREIQSLMAAKHEHIVSLEEVLDSDNNIFIVMELCGGGSMVDIVRLYPEERMPEKTARFFMRQLFAALAFCHSNGICHRDVRLDNFMLDNSGNAKITDFGHSGMYTPGWDLFSTALVGSVHNLSPEQILGQVYSGEKIDIWSAGVAIYCLLVGHPPFYDPDGDVNALLQRITECSYSIPDFVSEKARDFIKCMIRASSEERIPIHQMLHHPWFYDGPEYGPSMNVVVFPVDVFYLKRPDIAEMILAMTIYQHNLHFHLADTHNPMSSPEELRGQDWTLRCLCPRNDIKFTVSFFTKPPHPVKKKKVAGLPTCSSSLALLPTNLVTDSVNARKRDMGFRNPGVSTGSLGCHVSTVGTLMSSDNSFLSNDPNHGIVIRQSDKVKSDISAARPPLQRKSFKVTAMDVAAHIRASVAAAPMPFDPFDFEPKESDNASAWYSFQDDWLLKRDNENDETFENDEAIATEAQEKEGSESKKERRKQGTHSRSHSLDDSVGLRRIHRSATVDAFPYQKVIPQRKMPESVRNLDFGTPDGVMMDRSEYVTDGLDESEVDEGYREQRSDIPCESTPISPTGTKGDNMDGFGSIGEEEMSTPKNGPATDEAIAEKLVRHPSKTVSPQSPQVGRVGISSGASCQGPGLWCSNGSDATNGVPGTELGMKVGCVPVKEQHTGTIVHNGSSATVDANNKTGFGTMPHLNVGTTTMESSRGEGKANSSLGNKEHDFVGEESGSGGSGRQYIGGEGVEHESGVGDEEKEGGANKDRMQPFIEVRLQDGEAGLFLKICRKLKTICSTKLGEVAQRRKHMKTRERRSLTTLRRTASARSIDSESDVTGTDGGAASDTRSSITHL